ncbi:unnamed protein product [Amoebophrya sp. A120]|nr:unnamed protein product [Amoebophrya sp. A120]|eukprot:GSA120T00010991001.1
MKKEQAKSRKLEEEEALVDGELSVGEEDDLNEEVEDVDTSDFEDLEEEEDQGSDSEEEEDEDSKDNSAAEISSENQHADDQGGREEERPAGDAKAGGVLSVVKEEKQERQGAATRQGTTSSSSSSGGGVKKATGSKNLPGEVVDADLTNKTSSLVASKAAASTKQKGKKTAASKDADNYTTAASEGGPDEENQSDEDENSSIPSDEDTDNLEYGTDSDDSDDEAEKNRIGDVPLSWYENEDHIGYGLDGEKIGKSVQKSEIDQLLNKFDNPDAWRTITDVKNQEEIRLTDKDLEAIRRIMQHKAPYATTDMESMVEYDNPAEAIHPTTNRPEGKARFLPSKWEGMKIKKIVRLMREGKIGAPPPPKPDVFDIWRDDLPERRKPPTALVAPKLPLPTHAESFNPPEEYLMTEQEQKEWEDLDESERPNNFIPQKYGQLRKVPAYKNFIVERFHRCLDLYLVPRALKKRMNVAKESLLPQLPSPADLRPFPREISVRYDAHRKPIRSISVDNLGHYVATAADDGYCFVYEVATGRVVRRLKLGLYCQACCFHPKDPNLLAIASESDLYFVNLDLHKAWTEITEKTLGLPETGAEEDFGKGVEQEDDIEDLVEKDEVAQLEAEINNAANNEDEEEPTRMKKSLLKQVVWKRVVSGGGLKQGSSASSSSSSLMNKNSSSPTAGSAELLQNAASSDESGKTTQQFSETRSSILHKRGVRIHIEHDGCIKQLQWHRSGNYLSVTSVNCSSKANQCLIHSLPQKTTVKPFGKMKSGSGVSIQQAVFHPTKPLFFVATQRSVRMFHLQKHQLVKQLITGARWVSSLSVHPNGDHVIVGTLDRRLLWFDLDLGTKPYKTLKYHDKGLRQVAFYQKVLPHYADGNAARRAREADEDAGADVGSDEETKRSNLKPAPVSHFPLMCTASDDGSVHVFHARVYNDFVTNPLIVPVKKLQGHTKGVMDCVWHPTHPWVFTAGADGQAFLWV